MAKIRDDDSFLRIGFERVGGQWTELTIVSRQGVSDGVDEHTSDMHWRYNIPDLPVTLKTVLGDAWTEMKSHRDTVDPL